jgi:hypothetical protein
MQYGDSKWQEWLLGEEEAIKHIKIALALIALSFMYDLKWLPIGMTLAFRRSTPPMYVLLSLSYMFLIMSVRHIPTAFLK